MLEAGREPKARDELQVLVGLTHRQHFIKEYLKPLLASGWLEMTIPEKPRSSKQRYRLTQKGRSVLESGDDHS
jgi:ATP-dependent DNA helicase RecG